MATQISDNPDAPGDYPALQALGVRQAGGHVQLLLVNRDRTNGVKPRLVPDGLRGLLRVRLSSVTATSFQSYNDPDLPDAVTTTTKTWPTSGGTVSVPLPAHSVNLVDITAERP